MDDIERRILATLVDSPRAVFRDPEEVEALGAMALYVWHPVSDVYEMPGGGVIARITDAGRRALADSGVRQMSAPFKEGDIVRIKGNHHLGIHRVGECTWVDWTSPGVPPYWLCECTEIREPVDWSKYAPGTTGIVTGSFWRGSAHHLEVANSSGIRTK